jgi:tetratricopeptide (TPR) repeat protein
MALDVARADVHCQRALALLPPGHADRAKILAKAAEAAQQAGRVVQAEQLFNQAIVELQAQGNRLGAGDAMVRQANVLWYRGETARAHGMAVAAIELLERAPPGHELAAAYLELGKDVAASGQPKEALAWLRRAVSLADRLDADGIRQRALQLRGCARGEIGDLKGVDGVRESVELGLRLALAEEPLAYGNLGNELFKFEGPAAALPPMEAGLAVCEQRGIIEEAHWLSVGMVDCLAEQVDGTRPCGSPISCLHATPPGRRTPSSCCEEAVPAR